MRYTPPTTLNDTLRHLGWPADVLELDAVEKIDQVFSGTPLGAWAHGIVNVADSRMPDTTGVGYLDEESCLVGVGLADGTVAGCRTRHAVTGLERSDACFTLRAFDQGYTQVRPMPLAPVAIYDVVEGTAPDGSRFEPAKDTAALTAAAMTDLPPAAKIFAEVDPEQRDVVYDVWAVAPGEGGPEIWRRNDGRWEPDPGWLSTLRGSAPPALIYLAADSPVLADLLSQVDTSTAGKPFQALQASAVLAPEFYVDLLPLLARGNAEQLRQYWTTGEGGKVKIRWGVGGDFYRCVKHLRKYMGTRSKGYCNLLHKRALGFYPATHAKMEKGH